MVAELEFTWWGHAAVEVHASDGRSVLIDPWFGNPRSPKPADEVERCDVLLVTHGHSDHLGDAVAISGRTHPRWPCIHELSLWLGKHLAGASESVIGMNKGGTVELDGITVTMVHADHSAGEWSSETGSPMYYGEPVGFVVELPGGGRFYHAGDTDLFGDMRLIGELHRPDVAFLPIGGHYTMDPRAAAYAVELLGVGTVVPIHYGTFPLLAGTSDDLRTELASRGLPGVRVVSPEPGQRTSTAG